MYLKSGKEGEPIEQIQADHDEKDFRSYWYSIWKNDVLKEL